MKAKKIISILLCAALIFGVMSVGMTQAFATDDGDDRECPSNPGYTWDFSNNSPDSTYGEPTNTLEWTTNSYSNGVKLNGVTVKDTSVDVSDGQLNSNRSIFEMSQPVTLDSANDWTVRIVAKGKQEDGTTSGTIVNAPIRTVFSTARGYSEASFIFITSTGDILLGTKESGTFVTEDGIDFSNKYIYYKVSDKDFNSSILKDSQRFNILNENTYELKCIGGVFSAWVNNEKIGNLSMINTELNTRTIKNSYTGNRYAGRFKTMEMKFVGNGAKSNANYGLTGYVKSLGIYPGHTFTDADDTDCNNEGCNYVREAPHSYDDGVVTAYPTDTEEGVKIYTCTLCGATKTESIPCVSNREYYTWDFSSNTISEVGDNELTLATTLNDGTPATNGTFSVSNGRMDVNKATLEMSKPINLDSSKNWAVDFKMKVKFDSKGNVIAPTVLFAENKMFANGISARMTNTGDLVLAEKPGKSYLYYFVSDDNYEQKINGKIDFSKDHIYRLKSTNGTISYWVDGKYIGDYDYKITGSMSRSDEKVKDPFTYESINAKLVGNGNSSNIRTFGFTGDVDKISFYTDSCELNLSVGLDSADPIDPIIGYPGESVKLPTPETEDTCKEFLGWNTKIDGTGTMYAAGDNYVFSGLEQQGLFGIWKDAHDFGEPAWSWTGNDTDGYTAATATFTCSQCQTTETVDANVTTEEPDGKVVYTATAEFEGETYTDQKTVFTDGVGATLAGHSISLEGDISVNFYMELSDEIAKSDTAYMQFNIPNTSEEYKFQKVYVKDVEEKAGYYQFKCRVAAKDMKSEVTATIIDPDNDKEGTPYSYSVYQYAKYLIDHQDDNQTFKNAVPLVQAMITYGENAAYYFDKTETEPAALNVAIPEYTSTVKSLPDGVAFDGATISLKSQTSLSLYFDSDTQPDLSCNDDGITYQIVNTAKNEYAIRIRGIAAYDLDKDFTVKINGNDAVKYSPLAYCYKAQNSSDTKLANTVKALYLYWQAAQDYFG